MSEVSSGSIFSAGQLHLQEVQLPKRGKTVTIGGRHYSLCGDNEKIRQLHEYLPSLTASTIQFDKVLLKLGMQDFASARANMIGNQIIVRSLTEEEKAIAEEMNGVVEQEIEDRQFRGAVLVVHDGKPILMKGYGSANVSGAPITEKTLFHIGSLTKQFTAVAVMQLIERGEIVSLDAKISRYLPPRYAENPIWKDVTIRQLLTHTSGIPNVPYPDIGVPHRYSSEEVIDLFANTPLDFEPGAYFNYSNSGYDLLGKIIEHVSGKPYDQFLDENIFTPLGMVSTVAGPSSDIEHCAQGFERMYEDGAPIIEEVAYHISHLSKAYAAGNMVSTIEDLSKWDAALRNNTILSPEGIAELYQFEEKSVFFPIDPDMHVDELQLPVLFNEEDTLITYPNTRYGLGLKIFPNAPKVGDVVEHSGSIPGFDAYIMRYPKLNSCIVVLSNMEDLTSQSNGGSKGLAQRLENCLAKISQK